MMSITIVAEVGSNWWRPDLGEAKQVAFEHVRQAAACGATAVKFQLFKANTLYSRERAPDQWKKTRQLELPLDWIPDLAKETHDCGLEFWVTPFDPDLAVEMCYVADVVKIASGDLTYDSLLKATCMAETVALSTGGADAVEVRHALDVLGRSPILMYCVSQYPARVADYLLESFPWSDRSLALGVSDHTNGGHLVRPAVQMGYTVFEKHFMLDDTPLDLPDYAVSMIPDNFSRYCRLIRDAFDYRYRSGFGERPDYYQRVWARRGPDGLRPAGKLVLAPLEEAEAK